MDDIAAGMPCTWVSDFEVRPAVIERIDRTDHTYPDFAVQSRDLRSDSLRTFVLSPIHDGATPQRLPASWPLNADEFFCAPRCGRFFMVIGWCTSPLCVRCSGSGRGFGSFVCMECAGEGYAQ